LDGSSPPLFVSRCRVVAMRRRSVHLGGILMRVTICDVVQGGLLVSRCCPAMDTTCVEVPRCRGFVRIARAI
jgi:hypothetical protein